MKRHLVIAPLAQKDLVALTLRLAELVGAAAAARVAVDLEERFKLLLHSPLMGYVGARPSTRELVLDKYVIVYRVHTDRIEIARVWHSKQKRPLRKPSKPTP